MKSIRTKTHLVARLNDPALIKGIKLNDAEELRILLPNKSVIVIKDGYVTIAR